MKNYPQKIKTSFLKIPFAVSIFIVLFILYHPEPCIAQKNHGIEESLQEFFIGQTVYAQHKNEIQFTTKPAYSEIQGSRTTNIPLQVEYGITNRFQVEMELPFSVGYSTTGERFSEVGNTGIGFLYNILSSNKPFAFSIAMDMDLPTQGRGKGIGRSKMKWEPSLIAARQLGKLQVHASFGAELSPGESTLNYNLATVYAFGNWRATLELNGDNEEEKTIYITPGLVWKGIDDFEFGLGIPKTVNKNNGYRGVIFMITYEFSLKNRVKN